MQMRSMLLGAMAVTLLMGGSVMAKDYAGGAIKSVKMGNHEVLTNAKGQTLYTYDKDAAGVSNCTGLCAFGWPPERAAKGATAGGGFAPINARRGAIWAFHGHPLYRYIGDHKAGDVKGDGVDGIWHAAIIR
ncbi:MAG TPA: hypothetical protein VGM83_00245 [Devosiaceae bacterium]